MTRPSVSRLLLLCFASAARLFSATDLWMISLPARSTRFSFPALTKSSPFSRVRLTCTVMVKTVWLRLLLVARYPFMGTCSRGIHKDRPAQAPNYLPTTLHALMFPQDHRELLVGSLRRHCGYI